MPSFTTGQLLTEFVLPLWWCVRVYRVIRLPSWEHVARSGFHLVSLCLIPAAVGTLLLLSILRFWHTLSCKDDATESRADRAADWLYLRRVTLTLKSRKDFLVFCWFISIWSPNSAHHGLGGIETDRKGMCVWIFLENSAYLIVSFGLSPLLHILLGFFFPLVCLIMFFVFIRKSHFHFGHLFWVTRCCSYPPDAGQR